VILIKVHLFTLFLITMSIVLQRLKFYRSMLHVYQPCHLLQGGANKSIPAGKRKKTPKQIENGDPGELKVNVLTTTVHRQR